MVMYSVLVDGRVLLYYTDIQYGKGAQLRYLEMQIPLGDITKPGRSRASISRYVVVHEQLLPGTRS